MSVVSLDVELDMSEIQQEAHRTYREASKWIESLAYNQLGNT